MKRNAIAVHRLDFNKNHRDGSPVEAVPMTIPVARIDYIDKFLVTTFSPGSSKPEPLEVTRIVRVNGDYTCVAETIEALTDAMNEEVA